MKVFIFPVLIFYKEHIIFLEIIANRSFSLLSRLYRFYDTHAIPKYWTFRYICIQLDIYMAHSQPTYIMRCIYRFGMYATHALYKRPPCAIESRWSTCDGRCAYATCALVTQWSGSHTRHHTLWHRHSYAIYAACASPMHHWYAADTQRMRNSSAGDVPPNHLGDLTAYLFIFTYAAQAPWHHRPVEQGHNKGSLWYDVLKEIFQYNRDASKFIGQWKMCWYKKIGF